MKTLKMDSSSRVAFISGQDVRVDAPEVTSWEWGAILKNVLKGIKPQLKYLPNTQPIGTYAAVAVHETVPTVNDDANVAELLNKSKIVDWRTRSWLICEVENIASVEKLEVYIGFRRFHRIPKSIRIDRVFLTIKGELVLWAAVYCPVVTPAEVGSPYNSAHYSLHDSKFCLMREGDMNSHVTTYPFLPEKILKRMHLEVDKYCADTRERLENIETVRKDVLKSVTRVRWPDEKR